MKLSELKPSYDPEVTKLILAEVAGDGPRREIDSDLNLVESKKNKGKGKEPEVLPTRVLAADLFFKTVEGFKFDQNVLEKLKAFIGEKRADPMLRFGAKDRGFSAGPLSGDAGPGTLVHAGLTHNVSIVYTLAGRHPRVITLFGVFTHDDLGTGHPANEKVMKQKRAAINGQTTFHVLAKDAELNPTDRPRPGR